MLFEVLINKYRLYDAMRFRFIPNLPARQMTKEEVEASGEHFANAGCSHLQWIRADVPEQKTKSYTIKRQNK